MTQEDDLCPHCLKNGLRSQVQTYQINWNSAMILCPNSQCIYPLDQELTLIDSDGKKRANEETSIDQDVFRDTLKKLSLKFETCSTRSKEKLMEDLSDSSREMIDSNLPDNIASDFPTDDCLEAYLAGDEDDSEGFTDFLDFLSNLPGATFASFADVSTSRISEIRKQQFEVMKVFSPPVMVLNKDLQRSQLSTLMRQSDHFSSASSEKPSSSFDNIFVDSTEPRRYTQWNEAVNRSYSWLISGLSAIIHCRFIRCILKLISQRSSETEQTRKLSIVSLIFNDFELAMRKLYVALTLCSDNSNAAMAFLNSDRMNRFEPSNTSFDYLTFGDKSSVKIPRPMHQRIVDHLSSCLTSVMQGLKKDDKILNHPADLISYLLHSHDALRDLSIVSFRQTFSCSVCQYYSCEDRVSRAVTIECIDYLSTFSLSGTNCRVANICPACGASDQSALIEWLMVSPILFLHFPKGLPNDCEFEKLSLNVSSVNLSKETIVGIDRYCITSRGQFELKVSTVITHNCEDGRNQYTTWIKRSSDSWMACKESLGDNSYLTEWDPMKSPKSTNQPAGSVRILLLEAVPTTRMDSHSTQIKNSAPKSQLHERLANIMQERKRQFLHEKAISDSANRNDSSSTKSKASTAMIHRFLNSEGDLLFDRRNKRFQPYPSDNQSIKIQQPDILRSRKSESDMFNGRYRAIEVYDPVEGIRAKSRKYLKKRASSTNLRESQLGYKAICLWPSKKSKSTPSTVRIPKTEVSASSNSQTEKEPVTFSIDATTSFIDGQSSELKGQ